MRTLTLNATVTALSSIAHGGKKLSITTLLRRERFVLPNGEIVDIPVISGNSIRGNLRDAGMLHMCMALGYGVDSNGQVKGLTPAAFDFLFSGGNLDGGGGRGIDIDMQREFNRLIPLSAVFGGSRGNYIMPGKLDMGKMYPICEETKHLLPDYLTEGKHLNSIFDHLQREMGTRMDNKKNNNLNHVIEPGERRLLESMIGEKENRNSSLEPLDDVGHNTQMMYYTETIAAGTQFAWSIDLRDVTDLEFEAFAAAFGAWSKRPVIGGKGATGYGRVAVKFDNWLAIDSRVLDTGSEVSMPIGTAYLSHIEKNAEEIRKILGDIK